MTRHTGKLTRLLAVVVVAASAAAIAAPVSGASTLTAPRFPLPPVFSFPLVWPSGGGIAVGGNQIGSAGCVGTNRPSVGGNNGSTSAQTCGAILSFVGPQIGQIASVVGPTLINSPNSVVIVSNGPVTQVLP
jgi:hypothetical protein